MVGLKQFDEYLNLKVSFFTCVWVVAAMQVASEWGGAVQLPYLIVILTL